MTSADLERTARALRVLASPFDHEHVDVWRGAVNRELRMLLGADTAGFMLPVREGLVMYSEGHDPAALARYTEFPPPPGAGGVPAWKLLLDARVGTLGEVYRTDLPNYLSSTYYNEYAGANHAHDTLAMSVSVGGADPGSMASIQLWHDRPDGRRFGTRETDLLRLLYPAFQAGVESWSSWGAMRGDFLHAMDGADPPAALFDASGTLLHRTPALRTLLGQDPEERVIRATIEDVARRLASIARDGSSREAATGASPLVRQVRTGSARYRIRGFLYGGRGRAGAPLLVTVVQPMRATLPDCSELRDHFGLTRRQAEVARLLAQRKTNPEIAEMLCISPHTARRHTEAVFSKLGVGDRREVAAAVKGVAAAP